MQIGIESAPYKLAESLDINIRNEPLPRRIRGYFEKNSRSIVINSNDRPERRIFTLAHELGEFQAPSGLTHYYRERFANEFACELLLPEVEFVSSGNLHDWDLAVLKTMFPSTSWEVIAKRVLRFHECVITIIDNGKVYFRKGNRIRFGKELVPEETEACCKAPHELFGEQCRVRSWRITEDVERVFILAESLE